MAKNLFLKISIYSVCVGILYIRMVGGFHWGIGLGLFVSFVVVGQILLVWKKRQGNGIIPLVLLGGALAVAWSFSLYENQSMRASGVLIILFLLTLGNILLVQGTEGNRFFKLPENIFGVYDSYRKQFREKRNESLSMNLIKNESIKSNIKPVLIGLGSALLALIVIFPLLMSADAFFENDMIVIIRTIGEYINPYILFKFFITIVVAFLVLYYMFSRLQKGKHEGKHPNYTIDNAGIITFLAILDLVYIVFSMYQLVYFYAINGGGLPSGMTFSVYAVSGFNQLLTVTLINFCIFMVINGGKTAGKLIYKILLSILLSTNLIIVIASFIRLDLYMGVYGYSILRVFSTSLVLYLGLVCIFGLIGIFKRSLSFHKSAIILGVFYYVIMSYLNIHGYVAQKNIERYYRLGGQIDIEYLLYSLSIEATEHIIPLVKDKDTKIANKVIERINELSKFENTRKTSRDWQSRNYSQAKTLKLYENFKKEQTSKGKH